MLFSLLINIIVLLSLVPAGDGQFRDVETPAQNVVWAIFTDYVRTLVLGCVMDDPKTERRRERWRRNKRDARMRAKPVRLCLSPELDAQLMVERDQRAAIATRCWHHRHTHQLGYDVGRNAEFAADVWAARALLERELGPNMATPTRISRWLVQSDRTHSYAANSLRPMIYFALKLIYALETKPHLDGAGENYWPSSDRPPKSAA